jgi:hypothetical protein
MTTHLPAETVRISPEALEVANAYLQLNDARAVAQESLAIQARRMACDRVVRSRNRATRAQWARSDPQAARALARRC